MVDIVVLGADGTTASTHTTITADKAWVIGRSSEADIVVDDERVSRRHLEVESVGPTWVVRDISSNGSWHAGARIGRDGLTVPAAGEVRVNLGDRAGPEVVIVGDRPLGLADLTTVPATSTAPAAWSESPTSVASLPDPFATVRLDKPAGPTGHTGPTGATGPVVPIAAGGGSAGPVARPRKHRGRRVLVIALVVLVVLLAIADRVAARLASTAAVGQVVQQSQGMASRPTVSFGGIPFLTQVAFGKYTDISIGIDDVTASGAPHIEHIQAHLKGAHIPLSKAISGKVSSIPVDHVTATVLMSFADLNAFLKNQPGNLVLAPSGSAVNVTGSVVEEGMTINVSGTAMLGADGGVLTITPTNMQIVGNGQDTDGLSSITDALGGLPAIFPPIPVPMGSLPFGLRLTSVRATNSGVTASAAVDNLVLNGTQ